MSQTWWNAASQRGTYARSHLSGQNQVMGRSAYNFGAMIPVVNQLNWTAALVHSADPNARYAGLK